MINTPDTLADTLINVTPTNYAVEPHLKPVSTDNTDELVEYELSRVSSARGIDIYEVHCTSEPTVASIRLAFCVPAKGVKGVWTADSLYEKRLRADWEGPDCTSHVSVGAPVVSVFGNNDESVVTFACSAALPIIAMRAPVREEDNLLYCSIDLPLAKAGNRMQVSIDRSRSRFGESLKRVSKWWAEDCGYSPMLVPDSARAPVYSTWYAYHQVLETQRLIEECKAAKSLGCEVLIIDDGWQTLDSNRGYDYAGQWEPERLTDLRHLSDQVHALGVKIMLWFSVPFCGVKTQAYQRFKGNMLTENHRWAPVFDPRYPEVREYLISKYEEAIKSYDLDGLKLDFIDDFAVYPETPTGAKDGRDIAEVHDAVERLLGDVMHRLRKLKPDLLIEFRQRYSGPVMRKFGNMVRAFDCPADAVTNRIRTSDLRWLWGKSAVHSDMLTWHPDCKVEVAALQLNSVLFSVPQISISLLDAREEFKEMIAFYLAFFTANKALLLDGHFTAHNPIANYPVLEASTIDKQIIGLYADAPARLLQDKQEYAVINGSLATRIIIVVPLTMQDVSLTIQDCRGRVVKSDKLTITKGLHEFAVPAGGIVSLVAK